MSTPNLATLTSLMNGGVDEGLVTTSASQKVISQASTQHGFQILQGADGQHPDELESSSVTMALLVVDDSGSMSRFQQAVIDSYNEALSKMGRSQERPNIKGSLWTVREAPKNNSKGFLSIPDVNLDPNKILHNAAALPANQGTLPPADRNLFRTDAGGTALHDTVFQALSGALALATQYEKAGALNRLVVVIISDGEDNCSRHSKAADVHDLMAAAMKREKIIPAFFGLSDPGSEKVFQDIAKSYGIPDRNTKVATQVSKQTLSDIFNFVSATIISASQGVIPAAASQSVISGQSPFLV